MADTASPDDFPDVVHPDQLPDVQTVSPDQLPDAAPESPGPFKKAYHFAFNPLVHFNRLSAQDAANIRPALRNLADPIKGVLETMATDPGPVTLLDELSAAGVNVAQHAAEGFTSPVGIATLGAGALPVAMQRIISAIFAANAVAQTPSAVKATAEAIKSGDAQQIAETGGNLAINTLLGGLTAKHALTSPVAGPPPLPAEPPPLPPEPQVPAQVSSVPPESPSAPAPADLPPQPAENNTPAPETTPSVPEPITPVGETTPPVNGTAAPVGEPSAVPTLRPTEPLMEETTALRMRQHSEKFLADPRTSDPAKAAATDFWMTERPFSGLETTATKFIDRVGEEAAHQEVVSGDSMLAGDELTAIRAKLIDRYRTQGDIARVSGDSQKADSYDLKEGQLHDASAGRVTSVAQELSAQRMLGQMSPEAIIRDADKIEGFRGMTPEQRQEMLIRAARIARMPVNSIQRERAGVELMTDVKRWKGVPLGERAMSFYISNMLMGGLTHAQNLISTAINTSKHFGYLVLRQPKAAQELLAGVARGGYSGMLDALEVMQTGIASGKLEGKLRAGETFEALDKSMAKLNPMRLYKYNRRMMAAEDLLFFRSIEEARTVAAARYLARTKGLSGEALRQATADALGQVPEKIKAAKVQARSENLTGLDFQRRWRQIVRQGRDPRLQEDALDYALRVTFNNHGYGMLGTVTDMMNMASQRHPAVKIIQPFVTVVNNVANEQLSNTPWTGTYRLWRAYKTGEMHGKPLSLDRQEVFDQQAKVVAASVGLATVAALAANELHNPNASFTVHGGGPANKDAKEGLRRAGWIPYSLQFGHTFIPYLSLPSGMALATIGDYLDGHRYHDLEGMTAATKVGVFLRAHWASILNQASMQGLSSVLEMAHDKSYKNLGDNLERKAGRFAAHAIVPAFVMELDRWNDPVLRDGNGLVGSFVASTPYLRTEGKPAINMLGQPLERFNSERFIGTRSPDPVWQLFAQKNAWPTPPPADAVVGDKRKGPDYFRALTDAEHYQWTHESGQRIYERIYDALDNLRDEEPEKVKSFVAKVTAEEHAKAKTRLGLDRP